MFVIMRTLDYYDKNDNHNTNRPKKQNLQNSGSKDGYTVTVFPFSQKYSLNSVIITYKPLEELPEIYFPPLLGGP